MAVSGGAPVIGGVAVSGGVAVTVTVAEMGGAMVITPVAVTGGVSVTVVVVVSVAVSVMAAPATAVAINDSHGMDVAAGSATGGATKKPCPIVQPASQKTNINPTVKSCVRVIIVIPPLRTDCHRRNAAPTTRARVASPVRAIVPQLPGNENGHR